MKIARNEKELAQVKSKIMEAALNIIANEGYDALTMRGLASRIHMTAPNIYNYFSGKEEIYITLVIQGFEMLFDRLEKAYTSSNDPKKRARSLLMIYYIFGLENSNYYDIMFTRPTPKYKDYVGTPFERLSKIEYEISMNVVTLGVKAVMDLMKKKVSKDQALMNIVQVWSLLHGMISLYHSKVIEYVAPDPKKMFEKIIDQALELFTGEQGDVMRKAQK
jgi:AcrR family transcriptional regulator